MALKLIKDNYMKILIYTYLSLILLNFSTLAQEVWEIYDVMPISYAGSEAVVHEDKIYLVGGYADSVQMPVSWIHSYDPDNKQWQYEQSMLYARLEFVAGISSNKLFVAGGAEFPANNKNVESWDFNSAHSTSIAISHDYFNRFFTSGFVKNNYIYLLGGLTYSNVPFIAKFNLNDVNDFTVFNDDSTFGSNPLPISLMTAEMNGWIYILGGIQFGISQKIHRINLDLQVMEEVHPYMSSPRALGKAIAVPDENKIYLIGGQNESYSALSSVEIFTIGDSIHSIEPGPPLNIPRSNFSAVLFENKIYVFGGYDQFGDPVSEVEVLSIGGGVVSAESEFQDKISFKLNQNYPNPFNPSTIISYSIPENSFINLSVYSSNGELIKTLINEEQSAGDYSVTWDSKNNFGANVAAGVYFYRLSSNDFIKTKSMILLK